MSDGLNDPQAGPDAMLSRELPPSRGQFEAIAVAALELLGVQRPKHRLDATIALTRLRLARDRHPDPPVVIDEIPEF